MFLPACTHVTTTWHDLQDLAVAINKNESTETIKKMLDHAGDVNAQDAETGCTLLYIAAHKGNLEITTELITRGAKINTEAQDKSGQTPLMAAIIAGNDAVAKLLLNHGANVNPKEPTTGCSPLHFAAYKGNLELIELLLSKGANINAKDCCGQTPLNHAIGGAKIEVVQPISFPFVIRRAYPESLVVVKTLLAHGPDINAQDRTIGFTPLHMAVFLGSIELTKLLIAYGAIIDVPAHGIDPESYPSIEPYFKKIHDDFSKLNNSQKDTVRKIGKGETPLHIAARVGNLEIIKVLLAHGANINARSTIGVTPLEIAVMYGYIDAVKLLITKGATINVCSDKATPLRMAVYLNHIDIVKTLLANGAKINIQGSQGKTALQDAIKYGRTEIEKLLRDHSTH